MGDRPEHPHQRRHLHGLNAATSPRALFAPPVRAGQTAGMARRRPRAHRPLSLNSSHWRADGAPKVRFDTEREAQAVAADRSREAGVVLGVYQCGFCHGWHMGRRGARDEV